MIGHQHLPASGDRPASCVRIELAHDLRNHLHALTGLLELVHQGVDRIRGQDTLVMAQSAMDLLVAQFALLKAQRQPAAALGRTGAGTIGDQLAATLALYTPLARANGLQIHSRVDAGMGTAAVCAVDLHRLVSNLISNTIQHAKATELHISATERAGRAEIHLSDNGRGMKDDIRRTLQSVLDGCAPSAAYQRTGIRSCAAIARQSGMKLRLCEGYRDGVRWELTLPLAAGAAQRMAAPMLARADGLTARRAVSAPRRRRSDTQESGFAALGF